MDTTEIVNEIQEKYNIIGRERALSKIILARSVGKNILIEGEVGVGKTVLARAVADHYDSNFYRIDCSEETLPHNLVGYFDPPLVIKKGYSDETFVHGPLTAAMKDGDCLFINEINRMPESTQNVLLTALDERILEIPKLETIKASNSSFFVIATQNPEAHVGVTVLGEAMKDRFVWIKLDYQPKSEEIQIILQEVGLEGKDGEKIAEIAQAIIQATRDSTSVRRGSSIRGGIDLAALMSKQDSIHSTHAWVESSIMALYNKIELEDGIMRTKKKILKDLVMSVLQNTDFQ